MTETTAADTRPTEIELAESLLQETWQDRVDADQRLAEARRRWADAEAARMGITQGSRVRFPGDERDWQIFACHAVHRSPDTHECVLEIQTHHIRDGLPVAVRIGRVPDLAATGDSE